MDNKQRARELLAAEYERADMPEAAARCRSGNPAVYMREPLKAIARVLEQAGAVGYDRELIVRMLKNHHDYRDEARYEQANLLEAADNAAGVRTVNRTPPAPAAVAGGEHWDAMAYKAACDAVEEWQRRALDAEATIQRMTDAFNAENGPTHMGEPVLAGSAASRPTDDALWDHTLQQRDRYHEVADDLAARIASITGQDIGEHSSANCPWQSAMDAADDYLAAQPAAGDAVVELRALRQAYVRLLEAGRDRIRDLGGACDPVDVMERNDVDLRRVDAFLATPAAQRPGVVDEASPWRPIHECPDSDDLFWFCRGDAVDGPRPPWFCDADYWDYFATAQAPPLPTAVLRPESGEAS